MEKDRIKRFYIMPNVWVTVTQSQVFNWIKLINEEGISTDCISISSKKHSDQDVKKIEDSISGRFIEIHDFSRLIVSDLFITYIFLKYYFKNVFRYNKIIFQTRIMSLGLTYAILNWLPKAKFIFEARGAGNEERIHTSKGKKETLKMKIKIFFSETNEKLIMKRSNKVICVSKTLKSYFLNKFELNEEKFSVFPGAADSELFFYNEGLRNDVRKELDLDSSDILIVYSGRLEMKWEIPDKIFDFFKDLHIKDRRFKLLLITPDVDLANELISDYQFENVTYVKKVELLEVNRYLNAADVGLLLRENIPMNNVASPTKFAEYLMAGLPVIISSGVHDFAENIYNTGYGVVVSTLGEISQEGYEKLVNSLNIDKTEIANWGLHNLSKRAYIENYINILKSI